MRYSGEEISVQSYYPVLPRPGKYPIKGKLMGTRDW